MFIATFFVPYCLVILLADGYPTEEQIQRDSFGELGDGNTIHSRGVAERDQAARWIKGIVPFVIAPEFNAKQQQMIRDSMRHIENRVLNILNAKPCVQFRPRKSSDKYFVTIKDGPTCRSSVGQAIDAEIHLNKISCFYDNTIMHELMHTLGFWHEQSRPDRDSYVNVNYANIETGYGMNFDKLPATQLDTLGTPYDYYSIMHYGPNAFSINKRPTMTRKNDGTTNLGGDSLTAIDIQEIKLYYKC